MSFGHPQIFFLKSNSIPSTDVHKVQIGCMISFDSKPCVFTSSINYVVFVIAGQCKWAVLWSSRDGRPYWFWKFFVLENNENKLVSFATHCPERPLSTSLYPWSPNLFLYICSHYVTSLFSVSWHYNKIIVLEVHYREFLLICVCHDFIIT